MATAETNSEATTRVRGAALIAGPLLLIGATALFASDGSFYDSSAAGALQFVAMAVFAIGIPALTAAAQPDFPRAAAALAAIGALGVTAGAGFGIERIYTGTGVATLEDVTAGGVLYALGLLFPLAMIGFGVCLARGSRVAVPSWAGWALVIGGALFPVSRIGELPALAVVVDVLLAAGLAPLGWQLVSGDVTASRSTSAQPATA